MKKLLPLLLLLLVGCFEAPETPEQIELGLQTRNELPPPQWKSFYTYYKMMPKGTMKKNVKWTTTNNGVYAYNVSIEGTWENQGIFHTLTASDSILQVVVSPNKLVINRKYADGTYRMVCAYFVKP